MHLHLLLVALLVSSSLGFTLTRVVRQPPFSHLSAKKSRRRTVADEMEALQRLEESSADTEAQDDSGGAPSGIDESTRAKLKAEIASPFRRLRQFFYVAAGVAGGLGGFFCDRILCSTYNCLGTLTSVPQLILALQGANEQGTPTDVAINIAIDLGAIIGTSQRSSSSHLSEYSGAVFLWDRDASAERAKIERFSLKEKRMSSRLSDSEVSEREEFLSRLPVEIIFSESNENVTRVVPLGDLQAKGQQNAIIVAGSQAFVKDAVLSARVEGSNLFTAKETYVIPVVYGEEQFEAEQGKGFGAKDSLTNVPYFGKPTQLNVWQAYLKQEIELAEKQGSKDVVKQGIVIAVNQKGRVIRRGIGLPPWKEICEEFSKKIKADK